MASKKKSKLLLLLRLLTPKQVAKMTKVSTGVRKVFLTDVMLGKESIAIKEVVKSKKSNKSNIIFLDRHRPEEIETDNDTLEDQGENSEESQLEENEQKVINFGKADDNTTFQKEKRTSPSAGTQETPEEIKIEDVEVDDLSLSKEEKALSSIGIKSQKEREAHDKAVFEAKEKEKISTSLFILDQKRKLEDLHEKLKKTELKASYKKAANTGEEFKNPDKKKESSEQQDLSKSDKLGILVNKRHY